jgi:hypothetical protein
LADSALARTTKVGGRLAHRDDVLAVMFRPGLVDPDRHRPAAIALERRRRRGVARARLVLLAHRVLEVEDHEVGVELARLLDGARIGGRQEQQRPAMAKLDGRHVPSPDSAWMQASSARAWTHNRQWS